MTTLRISHPITVDDLESFPNDLRYELHEGNLYIISPAIFWHSVVGRRIANALEAAGMVVGTDVGIKFKKNDTRAPDVGVFKSEPDITKAYFPPSDFMIVVEIVSESSEDQDRILKPLHYAKAGIPEYWRVEKDPTDVKDALIYQYKLSDEGKYLETRVIKLSELERETHR